MTENHYLVALFEHHKWSNLTLIDFCADLSDEMLALTVPGTFGGVRQTLVHVIANEEHYLTFFPGSGITQTIHQRGDFQGFPALRAAAERTGEAFIRQARTLANDARWQAEYEGETVTIDPTFPLIQAIHHGTEHRSHIRTILSAHGFAPPEIDGWTYEEALKGT
ncbi:MAG TPA: DinB family protein [Thermomicrobiales bacterium]|nr:DinB family protein [Thermomicrobiales bacterium]